MNFPHLHVTKIFLSASLVIATVSGCSQLHADSPAMVDSEEWQVIRVSDGDTIAVRQGQHEMKIRLCGIDAMEIKHGKQPGQPLGTEAKANLQRLVDEVGGKVMVSPVESDRYGRTVAEIFSSKNGVEKNFNEEQLSSGNAFLYRAYMAKCPNKLAFEKAEAIAQSKKLGVWGGNYQKPWDYRREQRSQR